MNLELSERRDCVGRRSFLRLCRPGQTASDLDFELRLLSAVLPAPEVAVAVPVVGRGGRLRFRLPWEGAIRHAILFTEMPGRPMRHDASDLRLYGRALAALHDALAATGIPPTRRIEPAALCRDAASWLRRGCPGAGPLADTVDTAAPRLVALLETARPTLGFLHGDSCLLNARLDDNGRVGFFDFEDCAHGPVALDLASMMTWLEAEADTAALWAALLEGYESRRALTPGDRDALRALMGLASVRVAGRLARFHSMAPALWDELHGRLRRQTAI